MRGLSASSGAFGRALGLVAIVAIIVAIAVHWRRGDEVAHVPSLAPSTPNDPITRELARCQAIGMAAENDADCKAAWTENRRRFFSLPPMDASPTASTTEQNTPSRVEDR